MEQKKKAGILSYIATPALSMIGYIVASLIFIFGFKIPDPVPVFIIFGVVQSFFMILFAVLPKKKKKIARYIASFFVGLFLLVLAGTLGRNNIQIEGFFFYLISGTMGGAIVHFMMAKILGPIFFARTWCSWGCWTTMFLDLLPYKENNARSKGFFSHFRYLHFGLSLLIVVAFYFGLKKTIIHTDPEALKTGMGTITELIWFLVGNGLYYAVGIALAIKMKDNRAFCKYVCPVSLFFKTINRVTLSRIKGSKDGCTNCNVCVSTCSMNVDIPKYINAGERVKSTECIMCMDCIAACPEANLKASVGFDFANKEHLRY